MTRFDPPRMVAAKDIKPGDMLDLEGDTYADPERESIYFQSELATVDGVERETPDCIANMVEGIDLFGFPPNHLLKVCGHEPD